MAILANSELEPDELADFAATLAKAARVGVRAVMARISKVRRARERAERKAAMLQRANDRIVRPRPEPDGELMPIVTFLDQVLGADPQEEPPMRDASGNLVEVRVREPWALHSLTSEGVNDESDNVEVMKAPAEPGLVRLTPVRIELLIERYVGWLAGEGREKLLRGVAETVHRRVDAVLAERRSGGAGDQHRSAGLDVGGRH